MNNDEVVRFAECILNSYTPVVWRESCIDNRLSADNHLATKVNTNTITSTRSTTTSITDTVTTTTTAKRRKRDHSFTIIIRILSQANTIKFQDIVDMDSLYNELERATGHSNMTLLCQGKKIVRCQQLLSQLPQPGPVGEIHLHGYVDGNFADDDTRSTAAKFSILIGQKLIRLVDRRDTTKNHGYDLRIACYDSLDDVQLRIMKLLPVVSEMSKLLAINMINSDGTTVMIVPSTTSSTLLGYDAWIRCTEIHVTVLTTTTPVDILSSSCYELKRLLTPASPLSHSLHDAYKHAKHGRIEACLTTLRTLTPHDVQQWILTSKVSSFVKKANDEWVRALFAEYSSYRRPDDDPATCWWNNKPRLKIMLEQEESVRTSDHGQSRFSATHGKSDAKKHGRPLDDATNYPEKFLSDVLPGGDWVDVAASMQHEIVVKHLPHFYPVETISERYHWISIGVLYLRTATTDYPELESISLYRRHNRARRGELRVGTSVPLDIEMYAAPVNSPTATSTQSMISLTNLINNLALSKTLTTLSQAAAPTIDDIDRRDVKLAQAQPKPIVVLAGSGS